MAIELNGNRKVNIELTERVTKLNTRASIFKMPRNIGFFLGGRAEYSLSKFVRYKQSYQTQNILN